MTIVEVVVAAALFLVVTLGILDVVDGTTRATAQTQARLEAGTLASEALERVKALPDATLGSSAGVANAIAGGFGATSVEGSTFAVRQFEVGVAACASNVDANGVATACTPDATGDLAVVAVDVRWTRPRVGHVELRSARTVEPAPSEPAALTADELVGGSAADLAPPRRVDAAAALAVADRAWPASPCVGRAFVVLDGVTIASRGEPGRIAEASLPGNPDAPDGCQITVMPSWWAAADAVARCDVLVHEAGHLAGKAHTATGIMEAVGIFDWPGCDERAPLRRNVQRKLVRRFHAVDVFCYPRQGRPYFGCDVYVPGAVVRYVRARLHGDALVEPVPAARPKARAAAKPKRKAKPKADEPDPLQDCVWRRECGYL